MSDAVDHRGKLRVSMRQRVFSCTPTPEVLPNLLRAASSAGIKAQFEGRRSTAWVRRHYSGVSIQVGGYVKDKLTRVLSF